MLNIIDIVLVVLYLIVTITIGILFRGRQENAEDYFTAGGLYPVSFFQ